MRGTAIVSSKASDSHRPSAGVWMGRLVAASAQQRRPAASDSACGLGSTRECANAGAGVTAPTQARAVAHAPNHNFTMSRRERTPQPQAPA